MMQPALPQELVIPRDGMVLTHSVKFKPGVYVLADKGGDGVIRVGAKGITIDFNGAKILSVKEPKAGARDGFEGKGLVIDGFSDVVVKNPVVQGYRFNLVAVNAPGLRVEGGDLSYSRAQRIGEAGKPLEKWLELRSLDAWRDYGAGAWIEKSPRATFSSTNARFAQNGFVLVASDEASVRACDGSYNSGWGIALWSSSKGSFSWNHFDFCNRPWGGGTGGDAAGFAVVNGSNENMILGNSFTHGGDGLFLTDLVNGGYDSATKSFHFQGSSNDNTIAYNDGSWSPHNAFEGTFSFRNQYLRNWAEFSNYGFWLGFSSETYIDYNEINDNSADGIAIEQGRDNWIINNGVRRNREVAVHLWGGKGEHLKDHPSTMNVIGLNIIRESRLAISAEGSTKTWNSSNEIKNAPLPPDLQAEGVLPEEFPGRHWLVPRAQRATELFAERPANFRYYREGKGPRGPQAIRFDDFSPIPTGS